MNNYQDITLLPDAEANLGFLWEKVYQQIHLALTENKNSMGLSDIGIAFPQYKKDSFPLGAKLRLFAETADQLQQFDLNKWLKRLADYTHCTSIKEVPPEVNRFAIFSRRQFVTNPLRLARRRAKRKGESLEKALAHYSGFTEQKSNLPYINMTSLSSKRKDKFRLFIEQKILDKPTGNEFSCYGLSSNDKSKTATVPWF